MKFFAALIPIVLLTASCRTRQPDVGSCLNNLREIDVQKQNWTLEHHKTTNDTPTWDDLRHYFLRSVPPRCPNGGTYTIGRVGEWPSCTIPEDEAYFQQYTKTK